MLWSAPSITTRRQWCLHQNKSMNDVYDDQCTQSQLQLDMSQTTEQTADLRCIFVNEKYKPRYRLFLQANRKFRVWIVCRRLLTLYAVITGKNRHKPEWSTFFFIMEMSNMFTFDTTTEADNFWNNCHKITIYTCTGRRQNPQTLL